MTNPDNVGGLPDGMVMVQRSDAMRLAMFVEPLLTGGAVQLSARRIAELCRAAPAGGDVTRRWHIERDGNDLLVCKGYHHRSDGCEFVRYTIAEDSAPAGAGELATELSEALHADGWTVLDPGQFGPNVSSLLRKLQQGADYTRVGWLSVGPSRDVSFGVNNRSVEDRPGTYDLYIASQAQEGDHGNR